MRPVKRPLVDCQGAAEYLGFFKKEGTRDGKPIPDERPIRRFVAEKRIPYYKLGRAVRLDLDDLDTWKQKNKVLPADWED